MKRIGLFAFDGCQALDLVGPMEVFAKANEKSGGSYYEIEIIGITKNQITANCALRFQVDACYQTIDLPLDTLLICGASTDGLKNIVRNKNLLNWVKEQASTRRLGSVCTGAFILAAAGILDNRRATTHWASCETLKNMFPAIDVRENDLFVIDGNIATSAGVSAGIDLALFLVEQDLGREVSLKVAQELVLFLQRPANQSQLSSILQVQFLVTDKLRTSLDWAFTNLDKDLSVDNLAAKAQMSPRNYARIFKQETGSTPASVIQSVRVLRAREMLMTTDFPLQRVETLCGFGSSESMRRLFAKFLNTTPGSLRTT